MSLVFVYAISLVAAFVAWYACGVIPGSALRGILRATFIALLCSPVIIIGHGIGVVPTLTALSIQPNILTFGSMLVVWVIALTVIFAVPPLRTHRNDWPPSAREVFLRAYGAKFAFFGVVAALLMQVLVYADRHSLWIEALTYGLFFAGAAINLALCHWAAHRKQANPFLIPLLFAAPPLLVAGPTVTFMWYGGGAIGGLIGSGHQRIAAWVSLSVFSLLAANSLFRVYLAATALPHVTIGGGVAGNAAMATLFALLAIVPWWMLREPPNKS